MNVRTRKKKKREKRERCKKNCETKKTKAKTE